MYFLCIYPCVELAEPLVSPQICEKFLQIFSALLFLSYISRTPFACIRPRNSYHSSVILFIFFYNFFNLPSDWRISVDLCSISLTFSSVSNLLLSPLNICKGPVCSFQYLSHLRAFSVEYFKKFLDNESHFATSLKSSTFYYMLDIVGERCKNCNFCYLPLKVFIFVLTDS